MTDGLLLQTSSNSSAYCPEDVGVSDLLFLEPLTEQSFIDNLRRRFHADKIYTSMGSLMLSINPYRPLPLYDEQTLRLYRFRRVTDLPPHIFGIATAAYRELTGHGTNQVIILSGESGSGKTEIAKLVIETMASVAGNTRESDDINGRLTKFNQVLEGTLSGSIAFGNAKTDKNDNASRFGKYTDIAFNSHGETVGAIVTTYQLDKSRVVSQGPRERNFHIFYQILAGADVHLLKSLKLQRNAEKYSILRLSGVYKLDGLDEKKEFVITKEALDILGFSTTECQSVFQILAAVLKLGNLHFLPRTDVDGTESCTVLNEHELAEVAELLEYSDHKRFLSVLTKGQLQLKNEVMESALSAQEACSLRDQLCKALYSRLFTWTVAKINGCLSYASSTSRSILGILDMYGFESFELNGFEQFVINYTSEKLHLVVSDMIMKHEQEEYVREGLPWTAIPYCSNAEVCELIEKNHYGLLSILDEVCLREDSISDEHLLHKFSRQHAGHNNFMPPQERSTNNVPMDQFKIKHFAGTVTYHTHGFVEKNLDHINRGVAELMYSCRHPLAKELFPDGNPLRVTTKRPSTAVTVLRVSLASLLNGISTKTPTLVKCIKPNDSKRPSFFDEERVKHQIRYMGLVDQVRVRRAGYAFRQPYDTFLKHFKMLSRMTWPTWDGDPKDGVRCLLLSLELKPIEFAFGRTKVYIKFCETMSRLDDLRRATLEDIAVLIQKTFRGYLVRKGLRNSAANTNSVPSSLQSSKDSSASRRGVLTKFMMRPIYNDQHSSVSSSMDSSHSVPYTPCNSNFFAQSFTALPTATAGVGAVTAVPVTFVKPQVPLKPKSVHSQSSNNIALMNVHKAKPPPPPIRRTMTLGNCVGRRAPSVDKDEASRRITELLRNYIRYKFLVNLLRHLPTLSPLDNRWPVKCPSLCIPANIHLKEIHHKWRCAKLRARHDSVSRSRMREKVAASSIFLGKKVTYPKTVPHPFRGDYVRVRSNVKWRKLSQDTNDQYVVFADIMPKINRASGRPSYVLAVISTKAFLVIDQRTMIIKYRIEAKDIARLSVSPFQDNIVVIHLRPGELFRRKGDFMFESAHVIEMVTKLCLVVQNNISKPPEVVIASEFPVHFGSHMVLVHFKAEEGSPEFTPEVTPPGSVKVTRRTPNRMEVALSLDKS